jgi:hypothetical protein
LLRGVFDRRLRLTVGLPLILCLNTRQVAGVLAHEFGHFRQTHGLKTAYLIRRINQWFVDAAYERDAWDAKLADWLQSADLRTGWVIWLAQAAIYVARLVLIGLIYVGHFFCARLLREMEFDADRVEARIAGSRNFARTCRDMRLIEVSQLGALDELDRYRRESRLPDNWPGLIAANVGRIDADKFRELETKLLEVQTAWYDSHPSDRDRIANAAREQTEGTFCLESPGATLLSDFHGLARVLTLQWYRQVFGPKFDPRTIRETSQLIAARNVEITQGEAALRFVFEQFCHLHTFHLPRFTLGESIDAKQYRQNTQMRREGLRQNLRSYVLARKREEIWRENLAKVAGARRLIEAGVDVSRMSEFSTAKNRAEIQSRVAELACEEQQLKSELRGFRQMLGYRLLDALEFLRADAIFFAIRTCHC